MTDTSATSQAKPPSLPTWDLPPAHWVIGASLGTLFGFLVAIVPALFVKEPHIDVPPLPAAPPPTASHASGILNPWATASGSGALLGDPLGEWDDDEDPIGSASAQVENAPVWEATALVSGIDRERALRILRRHYDSVEECYQEHRGKAKKTRIGIGFAIAIDGSVSDIRITENSAHNRELQNCVTDIFQKLRFRMGDDAERGTISLRYVFE